MKLTLQPHPKCSEYGEVVDIYSEEDLPWASVHVDAFLTQDGNELYDRLYNKKETVIVSLKIVDQDSNNK